jgi:hypothetical protein
MTLLHRAKKFKNKRSGRRHHHSNVDEGRKPHLESGMWDKNGTLGALSLISGGLVAFLVLSSNLFGLCGVVSNPVKTTIFGAAIGSWGLGRTPSIAKALRCDSAFLLVLPYPIASIRKRVKKVHAPPVALN